jgi:hypothetical protein
MSQSLSEIRENSEISVNNPNELIGVVKAADFDDLDLPIHSDLNLKS